MSKLNKNSTNEKLRAEYMKEFNAEVEKAIAAGQRALDGINEMVDDTISRGIQNGILVYQLTSRQFYELEKIKFIELINAIIKSIKEEKPSWYVGCLNGFPSLESLPLKLNGVKMFFYVPIKFEKINGKEIQRIFVAF